MPIVRNYKGMSERDRAAAMERARHNLKIADENRKRAKAKFFRCLEEYRIWQRLFKEEGGDVSKT